MALMHHPILNRTIPVPDVPGVIDTYEQSGWVVADEPAQVNPAYAPGEKVEEKPTRRVRKPPSDEDE